MLSRVVFFYHGLLLLRFEPELRGVPVFFLLRFDWPLFVSFRNFQGLPFLSNPIWNASGFALGIHCRIRFHVWIRLHLEKLERLIVKIYSCAAVLEVSTSSHGQMRMHCHPSQPCDVIIGGFLLSHVYGARKSGAACAVNILRTVDGGARLTNRVPSGTKTIRGTRLGSSREQSPPTIVEHPCSALLVKSVALLTYCFLESLTFDIIHGVTGARQTFCQANFGDILFVEYLGR